MNKENYKKRKPRYNLKSEFHRRCDQLVNHSIYDPKTECWNWNGSTTGKGRWRYGALNVSFDELNIQRGIRSHRLSYMIFKGDIPKGMLVLHKCDNTLCCNPEHLFLGTQNDNMLDAQKKKRLPSHQGSKNANAKITEADVLEIRKLKKAKTSIPAIQKRFNLGRSTIWHIINRTTWNHIPEDI